MAGDLRPHGIRRFLAMASLLCIASSAAFASADWLTSYTIPVITWTGPSAGTVSTAKFNQSLADITAVDPDILFVGDSITDYFRSGMVGSPPKNYQRGINVWHANYEPRKAVNAGVAGETTMDVLWRLKVGNANGKLLDHASPKVIVLTIGHNNAPINATDGRSSNQDLADAMLAILKEMRTRCPDSTILFIPHFPTTATYWHLSRQNQAWLLASAVVAGDTKIIPLDLNASFTTTGVATGGVLKGTPDSANGGTDLIPDNVHPSEAGYQIWADAMEPTLSRLLGKLFEYAFGMNSGGRTIYNDPSLPEDLSQMPRTAVEGTDLAVTFRRGKAAFGNGVTFMVQGSPDLATWTDETAATGAALAGAPVSSDSDADTYTVPIAIAAKTKFFLRVNVTTTP